MKTIVRTIFFSLALCLASVAQAVTYDGSIVGDSYGLPVSVQTVNTMFGDDVDTDNIIKGSELDAAYARVDGGTLNLALTGNLQDNFDKLVIFFDSVPGGQNVLDTDTDFGGSNPVVDRAPDTLFSDGMFAKLESSSFDVGFEADYVMVLRHGFDGSANKFDVDFAVLGGDASSYLTVFTPAFSSGSDWTGSGTTGTGLANGAPIDIGFDNSNIAGVGAGDGTPTPGAPEAVTTGIEIGLPLSNIGNPTDEVKITAFINGSNHDFVSNQFLGGLPAPFGNLGTGSNGAFFTLSDYSGEQYFTVAIPEPSSMVLASLCLVGLSGRRRVM